AAPFDIQRLATTGPPLPVVHGVKRPNSSLSGSVYFALSDSGALVYISGPAALSSESDIALLDQQSGLVPLKLPPRPYGFPRVSPDGKWVAVGVDDGSSANVLVYELSGATALRQLTTRGKNRFPVWSWDNASVTFQSDRDGDLGIFRQPANGSRDAERLTTADPNTTHVPDAWSPDGGTLLFEESRNAYNTLKALSMTDKKATPVGDI